MSASFPYMPLFCSRYTPMVKQRSSYTLQVLGRSRVGPKYKIMDKDSDSTVTSLEENTDNFCTNPTSDILAAGIVNVFKPTIERLDECVLATKQSQAELKAQLDLLAVQLREIEKAQSGIPEFSEKVKELINIKHKVTIISNILSTSQDRLRNLHKLIEKEENRRKAFLESAINTNIS